MTMLIVSDEAVKAGATNVTPKIKVMFMKPLPIIFPRASVECPFKKP